MKFKAGRVLALAAAALAGGAVAEESDTEETSGLQVEQMTVVGTRTERSINQIDATVSVITDQQIEERLMRNIRDLVRYEPGVDVGGSAGGTRFGLGGFNIRGIDGNRVLTIVDNIRVPDQFGFGPFLQSERDFVDIDSISRVEIARGPISTLYGSDALGGVVAYRTRGPFDYVSADSPTALDLKAGYSSADNSWVGTGTFAGGNDRFAGLLSVTYRDAQETENQGEVGGTGPEREKPDPQDIQVRNVQLKGAWNVNDSHRLTLGYVDFRNDTDTQVLSDYDSQVFIPGVPPALLPTVNSRDTEDTRKRQRVSLEYDYGNELGILHTARAVVYYQTSETTQELFESRTSFGAGQLRERASFFDQDITGINLLFGREFVGAGKHALTFGGEYWEVDSSSLRDGGSFDPESGAEIPNPNLIFPTRDFPETTQKNAALFLQDEIMLFNDRLIITPGVRWDSYEATATADELYLNGNPGIEPPADYDDSDVTWKLGGVWSITDSVGVYARYSEGFRAPPYSDVNVGFTNVAGGYRTVSNPDLVSETSQGVEAGIRFGGDWGNLQFAAFTTDYDNFIESRVPVGQQDGLLIFTSINRDRVEIEGWELRGVLGLGTFTEALADFSVQGAAAYARGEDLDTGAPINEVQPLNTVLGLRWEPAAGRFNTELIWTWTDEKDEEDIDGDRLATDSWSVLDLIANVRITENWLLDVGIFNLTDKSYIRWIDTQAIGNDAPGRFTQPGTNFSATLRATF
ncbi:MAG: TonB-dependent hemoglobin/transferrin/lactoferrin family receptor [Pseudomonadota bacterium]